VHPPNDAALSLAVHSQLFKWDLLDFAKARDCAWRVKTNAALDEVPFGASILEHF
jgi:hypothetical protein